jgi:hypothetical protein
MKIFIISMTISCIVISLWYILPVGAQFQSEREYLIRKCLNSGGRPTNGGYGCVYPQPNREGYPPAANCQRGFHACGIYCCPNN